jgi:hypothetical protein
MKTFDKPFGPFVLKIKTEITQTAHLFIQITASKIDKCKEKEANIGETERKHEQKKSMYNLNIIFIIK